jgi:hypothetical protein
MNAKSASKAQTRTTAVGGNEHQREQERASTDVRARAHKGSWILGQSKGFHVGAAQLCPKDHRREAVVSWVDEVLRVGRTPCVQWLRQVRIERTSKTL